MFSLNVISCSSIHYQDLCFADTSHIVEIHLKNELNYFNSLSICEKIEHFDSLATNLIKSNWYFGDGALIYDTPCYNPLLFNDDFNMYHFMYEEINTLCNINFMDCSLFFQQFNSREFADTIPFILDTLVVTWYKYSSCDTNNFQSGKYKLSDCELSRKSWIKYLKQKKQKNVKFDEFLNQERIK